MTRAKEKYENVSKPAPGSEVEEKLLKVYGGKYDGWLRSYGLVMSWETPIDSLERFIWHGYRPNPSSLLYCLKSAFHPTNETLNFWTHFLPFLFLLWRSLVIFSELDDPLNWKYAVPWFSCLGCLYVLLASGFAHLLSCKSPTAQELGFCVDMNACAVFAFGNFFLSISHVCPLHSREFEDVWLLFIRAIAFLWLMVQFSQIFSRHERCPHPVLFRTAFPAILYATMMLPCFVRYFLFSDFGSPSGVATECNTMETLYARYFRFHFVCSVLAAIAKTLRQPEKSMPGWFDIVGNSHQIFHILTGFAAYYQHKMVEVAFLDIQSNSGSSSVPISPPFVLFGAVTYFVIFLTIIFKASVVMGKSIESRRNKKRL